MGLSVKWLFFFVATHIWIVTIHWNDVFPRYIRPICVLGTRKEPHQNKRISGLQSVFFIKWRKNSSIIIFIYQMKGKHLHYHYIANGVGIIYFTKFINFFFGNKKFINYCYPWHSFSNMDHPCKLNILEDQELSLQFFRPHESLLSGSQCSKNWPITFHTQI